MTGGGKGLVNDIVQGLKDGTVIVGGQIGARKIRGAITGMIPVTSQASVQSGAGYIALTVVSALIVSLAAKKFVPAYARMATAGAFSETINAALAQTPVAAYLGAFAPVRRRVIPSGAGNRRGVAAWPGASASYMALQGARTGVAAWPMPRSVGMPSNAGM